MCDSVFSVREEKKKKKIKFLIREASLYCVGNKVVLIENIS